MWWTLQWHYLFTENSIEQREVELQGSDVGLELVPS